MSKNHNTKNNDVHFITEGLDGIDGNNRHRQEYDQVCPAHSLNAKKNGKGWEVVNTANEAEHCRSAEETSLDGITARWGGHLKTVIGPNHS